MSEKIIKYFNVQEDADDSAVIDSNDRLQAAIEEYQKKAVLRREEERKRLLDKYRDSLTVDDDGNVVFPRDEDGNIIIPEDSQGNPLFSLSEDGLPMLDEEAPVEGEEGMEDGETVEAEPDPEEVLAEARAEAERLVQDAQAQADSLVDDANAQADDIRAQAQEEGRQAGFQEGQEQAEAEFADRQAELERHAQDLENDYQEKASSMEKDLVATITDVMEKFFKIELSDRKDVLLHVIENAVLNIENSRSFLIHVSQAQYEDVSGELNSLREKVGAESEIDVIMDPTLAEGSCLIETDGGIYDCSIDTELKSLSKELRELSIH
ncbi:MAG: FliH/SctL family protein [Lachnospiraceae bacterium]|nr:FliH/SctL family protein [Lachnospiraceae bacterium]